MAKKVIKGNDLIEDNVFSNFIKQAKEAESVVESLTAALKILPELAKQIKASTPKSTPTDTKGIKELEELQRKSNEVAKAKLSIDKELIREKVRLADANSRLNKTVKEELLTSGKVGNEYQKQSAILNKLRNEYKNLAVQNKENTKEAKALLKEITSLDNKLKNVDKSVGQSQRNVGNYGSALEGLKVKFSSLIGIASQFGLALGGVAIVKGAIDTVRVYEDAIADLSAITGKTGKDLDFFKNKSIELGVNVKGGASAVVEAYKLIASAKPELLENADALNSVTEAAILLSKASGMELPDAATALTDAMNQFGAGADQAGKFVDVLAAGAKFGSAEIPQITEALLKFGAVAKTTNVNIQESTGLIEALAEKGLKGAEAGTALRNVMLKLSAPDALPKEAQDRLAALGVNFDDLKDKSKPFSERLEALKPLLTDNAALIKVFGTENAVAATTLLTSTDRIKELTASVDENGVALEQQNAKSKTLSEAFNRLKETWNGFILNLSNGVGAANGMAGAMDFLANNLGTILTVLGKLIKLWIVYKTVTAALKLKESATAWNDNRKAIKETGDALKDGAGKAEGFGKALKSIGFAVAITLALELAQAFVKIMNGTQLAEAALVKYENTRKKIQLQIKAEGSVINQRLLREKELADNNIEILERERKQRIKNGESAKKVNAEINDEIKKINAELKKSFLGGDEFLGTKLEQNRRQIETYSSQIVVLQKEIETLTKIEEEEGSVRSAGKIEARNQIVILRERIKGLRDENEFRRELLGTTNNLNATTENAITTTVKETKAVKEKTKAMKSANDEVERAIALMKETQELDDEIALSEAELNLQFSIEAQLDSINQSGQYSIELINQRIQAEYELQRAIIERNYLEAIDTAQNEQEVINARKRRDFELGKLDELRLTKTNDINIQLEEAQEKHAEKIQEITVESITSNYEATAKALQIIEDLYTKQIDARIAKLQEEMDMAKKRADLYAELAANGNITAAQSLAEQDRIIAESEIRKAEEEKRKQQILIVTGILQAYNSNLAAGDNSTTAFTKAITSTELLKQFVSALPAFYEGAANVGESLGAPLLPGRDGHIIRVDGDERILNPMQNRAIGNMANDEVVRRVQMSKAMEAGNMSTSGWSDIGVLSQLNGLKSEMRDIKQAIIDKPVPFAEIGAITQKSFEIREGQRSPKFTTSRTFKVQR